MRDFNYIYLYIYSIGRTLTLHSINTDNSRDVATKELMKLLDDGKVCKMCTRLNSRCSSENM